MAKTVRIDAVKIAPNGEVSVEYTAGQGPLPGPSGQGITFTNMQDLFAAIARFEDEIADDQLAFLALAQWIKADPQMATLSLAKNKTAQLDLTGSGTVIRVS